jgi:hypothetical protein
MESNTNSVVESKLIVLNAKMGTNQRRVIWPRSSFLTFKGGGHFTGSVLFCPPRSRVVSITFVNDATFNYSVNSVEYSMLNRGQLHGDHVYSQSQFSNGIARFSCLQ